MKGGIFLILGIIIGVAGTFVYLKKLNLDNVNTLYVLNSDRRQSVQFSCKPVLGATLFPPAKPLEGSLAKIEGSIVKDSSTLAVEIDDKLLKLLTNTSVEVGSMDPAQFLITDNTDNKLIAVGVTRGTLGTDGTANAFVLDKTTGAAVWTKAATTSIIPDIPNAQAYYYSCN